MALQATRSAPANMRAARSAARWTSRSVHAALTSTRAPAGRSAAAPPRVRRRPGVRVDEGGRYVRPHAGGGPAGFTACASEGGTCTPSGDVDVAFGAVGSFLYQTGVVGSFACTNALFGSDPAYGWTKGCYTRPSGGGVAYEAEAATLAGAAVVVSCASCGGGEKVGFVGNGAANSVTFPQVDVGSSGTHTLVVHGVSADPRSFSVSVNGGAPISVNVQSGFCLDPDDGDRERDAAGRDQPHHAREPGGVRARFGSHRRVVAASRASGGGHFTVTSTLASAPP